MVSTWSVRWKGRAVAGKLQRAAVKGIDDTMADSTISAKRNHPGWKNISTKAEGSVRLVDPAHADGKGAVGKWGSKGVDYVIWLELKYGSFLRNAAQEHYPSLASRIRQHFEGIGI